MSMASPTPIHWSPEAAQTGILHRYSKRWVAFEHLSRSQSSAANIILWVGGLGDGLLTVGYPTAIAHALPQNWSLAEVMLSSAYNGFGTGSLARDAKELAQCVEYFRGKKLAKSKIVVMGHSTGCQDAMEYLTGAGREHRPAIDGVILQGSVSDREAMLMSMTKEQYDRAVSYAQEMVSSGRVDDVIPASAGITTFGRVPVTAYRWLSLLSPNGNGDDDYFSSDLPEERLKKTFGSINKETPVMFLMGGADQYVPPHVDRHALVAKWTQFVKEGGGAIDEVSGGVLPGAHHNMEEDDENVIKELCRRVNSFVERLDGGYFRSTSHL